jgi:hypothetical protein
MHRSPITLTRRLRPFALAGLAALVLAACGGGGGEDAPSASTPLTVTTEYAAGVRQLTPEQQAQATLDVDGSLAAPAALALKEGDVVVVQGTAVKLGAALAPAADGRARFATSTPRLEELFASLELDGQYSGFDSIEANDGTREKARGAAQKVGVTGCPFTNGIGGLSGVKCTFEAKTETSPVEATGTLAVGFSADLRKWNVIRNTGSGTFSVALETAVDIGMKMSAETASTFDSSCTSVGPWAANGRVRLTSLTVPTSLPGITLQVPVCVAFAGKAELVGGLVKLDDKLRLDVAVGNGQAPRLASTAPSAGSSGTRAADPGTDWTLKGDLSRQRSVLPVRAETTADFALEASLEVNAFKLASAGVGATLKGGGAATGEIAGVVIDVTRPLSAVATNALYCLTLRPTASVSARAYTAFPAFSLFGAGASQTSVPLVDVNLLQGRDDLALQAGKCDLKADTAVTIASALPAEPSLTKTFNVRVRKNDPLVGNLWDDRFPRGSVTLKTLNGADVCTAVLDTLGNGSCSHTFGGPARNETVVAHYEGNEYYRVSDSGGTRVAVDFGSLTYQITLTDTGTCDDSNFTAPQSGAIVQGTTLGKRTLVLGDRSFEINFPGSTTIQATYEDGVDGHTSETASFTISPPSPGITGTVTGGGSYAFTPGTVGTACSGSYTFSGTYAP